MIPVPRFCALCGAEMIAKIPEYDNRERRVCPRCGFVHYLQPKVAAGTIPERDGKIVLVRRGIEPRKGYWSFPCGFMEIDEDLPGAALRETEEETGLKVKLTGHLGSYSYRESEQWGSIVIVAFFAEVVGGDMRPGDDTCEVKLVDPKDIRWQDLAFQSAHDALRDWVKARRGG